MNRYEKTIMVVRETSRNVFILLLLSIFIGAITGIKILFWLDGFLLIVSWITPGILIIFKLPWLSHAWLRGINSTWIPSSPWEQLSDGKRFMIYFYSLIFSGFIVVACIMYVIQLFQK